MQTNQPEDVYVFIEIPKGSNIKIEYDEKLKALKVDRILFTATFYPFNYGFIPGTLGEDGDPLDCIVITFDPLPHGVYIRSIPIGALVTQDENGMDRKVIAVPHPSIDPKFENVRDLKDLPPGVKEQIEHFFMHYKELERGKWVKVTGYESAEKAREAIRQAIERTG
ncbi:MAG: inorganic diphosphatase [Nitrososphaerota archaeon]|jgi:inorganic pyrophosphatase|nr:inorganic diphosphatase [Nitrososphaerota archaeon]MDG6930610.1 inorganic diphosphatase [Nitrososphaerota archaeon]MDG6932765.1 inorganic diphosphatase [Nitrososphaerota archaeon]MDG6935846.1 inorganic diphosphatase [Nitrososphaerota archaeon]MDG6944167.1 inorganic diphosphatase [Nitrososphaerota archaeon]